MNDFNFLLTKTFLTSLRAKGMEVIHGQNIKNIQESNISTPTLSWIFSNRFSVNKDKLTKNLSLDEKRQKTIIGHNIFKRNVFEKYKKEEKRLQAVYLHIKNIWPEAYSLIDIISPIVSFQTDDRKEFESESDSKIFGQIIFNMKSDDLYHWSEIIIHEIAHHYLNILLATTSMTEETKTLFKNTAYSEIRKEERPIIGIFHGLFAQSCMMIYAAKVIKNAYASNEYKAKAQTTYLRYSQSFTNDFAQIKNTNLIETYKISSTIDQACQSLRILQEFFNA